MGKDAHLQIIFPVCDEDSNSGYSVQQKVRDRKFPIYDCMLSGVSGDALVMYDTLNRSGLGIFLCFMFIHMMYKNAQNVASRCHTWRGYNYSTFEVHFREDK